MINNDISRLGNSTSVYSEIKCVEDYREVPGTCIYTRCINNTISLRKYDRIPIYHKNKMCGLFSIEDDGTTVKVFSDFSCENCSFFCFLGGKNLKNMYRELKLNLIDVNFKLLVL